MFIRVEVAIQPEWVDPQAQAFLRKTELALPEIRKLIRWARVLDVTNIQIDAPREQLIPSLVQLFWDPVLSWLFTGDLAPGASGNKGSMVDLFEAAPFRSGCFWGIERRLRPGITDNVARSTLEAFEIMLGRKLSHGQISSGSLVVIEGPKLTEEHLSAIASQVICNDLIETWTLWTMDELRRNDRFHPDQIKWQLPKSPSRWDDRVETFDLDALKIEELVNLSQKRLWALQEPEMKAIREYFHTAQQTKNRAEKGLGIATDVEMEMLAQTWSEHCKHKLFNAKIQYRETGDWEGKGGDIPEEVDRLFKQTISGTTQKIKRPWLLSVFSDNAGIVKFDDEHSVCIKVETHNSPSALDPYGGALTGIVGVNRDILGCGRGARPIFNTDVFCVATPDYSGPIPDRLLHPRRILEGVRRGVEHGGNKSGIPTVNGALVFDDRYLGKPLIYCGTGGILPLMIQGEPSHEKKILPGDLIYMVGGRIGKDGIHGATVSSLAMDAQMPGSVVQLGDPITQKRMSDFLIEARDQGLYRTLTDNGAGGLSSSVGEMALISGGARMDVSLAPTKVPGLKPFELAVSESQERMTVAVPPENQKQFEALALARSVEATVIGEFDKSGFLEVQFKGKTVAYMSLEFLHGGVPQIEMKAKWSGPLIQVKSQNEDFRTQAPEVWLKMMARPNIASKEWLIRQYDHEVQASSVIKPLHVVGSGTANVRSGPNDAAVVRPKNDTWLGLAVGCGIQPRYSDFDPYVMAQASVDEAVRNVLCVGAEYGKDEHVFSLIDNFCWPDPQEDPIKAGALVRACYGMRDAALALQTPLISGKDSMKNDYRGKLNGKPHTISVPPTLLMTAMARVADIRMTRSSDVKAEGDRLYLLGPCEFGLLGSELEVSRRELGKPCFSQRDLRLPHANWKVARQVYSWIGGAIGEKQPLLRSAHDVSEGGLLVALAECLMARGFGARIELPRIAEEDLWAFCFGEGFHSFVVSASLENYRELEEEWMTLKLPFHPLGSAQAFSAGNEGKIDIKWSQGQCTQSTLALWNAWNKTEYWE